jgi:hypothetical protein
VILIFTDILPGLVVGRYDAQITNRIVSYFLFFSLSLLESFYIQLETEPIFFFSLLFFLIPAKVVVIRL